MDLAIIPKLDNLGYKYSYSLASRRDLTDLNFLSSILNGFLNGLDVVKLLDLYTL